MEVSQGVRVGAGRKIFHLSTLGALRLHAVGEGDGASLPASGKSLAFLAYLACSSRRSASRDRLAEMLWGASDIESAYQSIRQARSALKHMAGEELILVEGTLLSLAPCVRCDRDEFRALLAQDLLPDAIALYQGDFCEGFAASGADEFERWAEVERAMMRSLCSESISRLASHALTAARAMDALAFASRLASVDPFDERYWRIRLEALLLKHDDFGFAVASSECERWLSDERRESSRPLRQLLDRGCQTGSGASGVPSAEPQRKELHPDLIGREQQFADLLQAWKQVGAGKSACLLLLGPSGFGKTRLLHDFHERLISARARVVSLRALPADSDVKYALMSRLAAGIAALRGAAGLSGRSAAVLLGLNPALSLHFRGSTPDSPSATSAVTYIEALDELLGVVAEEHSVALVIDDLHWADAESAQILASLAERQTHRRILIVLAMRSRQVGSPRVPSGSQTLHVNGLTMDELDGLLASIAPFAPGVDTAWREQLHRASEGSPLLILESLRLAMDADCLGIADSGWTVRDAAGLEALLTRRTALADRLTRLDDNARQLALVLAVAGRPISQEALRSSTTDNEAANTPVLRELEHRDVASISPEGWIIAHDALAESLIAAAGADDLVLARRSAAQLLRQHVDAPSQRSAFHLYADLHDWSACAAIVGRLVREDSAGFAAATYAEALVSSLGDGEAQRQVRRRLPLQFRPQARRLLAASVFIAIATSGMFIWRRQDAEATSPPLSELVAIFSSKTAVREVHALALDESHWNSSTSIEAARAPLITVWPTENVQAGARVGPDGTIAMERTYGDSGGVDIALWSPRGEERRLTHEHGDDVPSGWAPDGSSLLIETSRWGSLGHRAIAALDIKTLRVRRVSSGGSRTSSDRNAAWSPDGSRIAFIRSYYALRPPDMCIVDSDGFGETCSILSQHPIRMVSGWLDTRRLLIQYDSSGSIQTGIVTVEDGKITSRFAEGSTCSASPGGQWIGCLSGDGSLTIAPSSAPDHSRRVNMPVSVGGYAWRVPISSHRAIERMRLTTKTNTIPVGASTQLTADARTADDEQVALQHVRWSLVDSTLGTITSSGVVTPSRPGLVRVRASAGGWRTTELRIPAVSMPPRRVAIERWDGNVETRWRYYGVPRPVVLKRGPGNVFFNNGEGDHVSGAYLKRRFAVRRGIWLETEVSTPVTATQWQSAEVTISSFGDFSALTHWDHRNGWIPSGTNTNGCVFAYPQGEGFESIQHLNGGADASPLLGFPVDSLSHGQWYRVLVQLFPDGHCGVAVNSRAVSTSPASAVGGDSAIVMLQGNSVGTHILFGTTSIGEGVRTDIRWLAPQGSQNAHALEPAVSAQLRHHLP